VGVLVAPLLVCLGESDRPNPDSASRNADPSGYDLAQTVNQTLHQLATARESIRWSQIQDLSKDELEIFLDYVNFDGLAQKDVDALVNEVASFRGPPDFAPKLDAYLTRIEQNAASDAELRALRRQAITLYELAILDGDKDRFDRLSGFLPALSEIQPSTESSLLIELALNDSDYPSFFSRIHDWDPELDWNLKDKNGVSAASAVVFGGRGEDLVDLIKKGIQVEVCKPGKKDFSSEKVWESIAHKHGEWYSSIGLELNPENLRRKFLDAAVEEKTYRIYEVETGSTMIDSEGDSVEFPYSRDTLFAILDELRRQTPHLFRGWCISDFLLEFDPTVAELFDEAVARNAHPLSPGNQPEGPCTEANLLRILEQYKGGVKEALRQGRQPVYYIQPELKCSMARIGVGKNEVRVEFPNDPRAEKWLRPIAERYLKAPVVQLVRERGAPAKSAK
jgi:hypothetical protein